MRYKPGLRLEHACASACVELLAAADERVAAMVDASEIRGSAAAAEASRQCLWRDGRGMAVLSPRIRCRPSAAAVDTFTAISGRGMRDELAFV